VQNESLTQPIVQLPPLQRPDSLPQTVTVAPSPPNRRRKSGPPEKQTPPTTSAGTLAQSPWPATSMQTSPTQSSSVTQSTSQKLARAVQSSFVLHAVVGSMQRFFTESHFFDVSWPATQSSSVVHL
jgi:hypothetical protein